jgi:hypothetical protein
MKELDLNFLKALSTKTNVIPVIAKADTMSAEERSMFKARVLADLQKYDIKVYPSSYTEDREAAQGAEVPILLCTMLNFYHQYRPTLHSLSLDRIDRLTWEGNGLGAECTAGVWQKSKILPIVISFIYDRY